MTGRLLVIAVCTALLAASCGGGWPVAATPTLVSVSREGSDVEAAADGSFPVLPTRAFGITMQAPWPAKLDVSLDSGEKLVELSPDDMEAWSDADLQDQGAWGTRAIDPDTSPPTWTLLVSPPPSMRLCSNTIGLAIRSVSIDPNLPEESRTSTPLTLTVGRSEELPAPFPLAIQTTHDSRAAQLVWQAVRHVQFYEILRAASPDGIFTPVASVGPKSLTYVDRTVAAGKQYTYRIAARLGRSVCSSSETKSIAMPAESGTASVQLLPNDPQRASRGWGARLVLDPQFPSSAIIEAVTNKSATVRATDLGTETDGLALDELAYTALGVTRRLALGAGATTTLFNGMTADGLFSADASPGLVCLPLGSGPRRGSVSEAGCKQVGLGLTVTWRLP